MSRVRSSLVWAAAVVLGAALVAATAQAAEGPAGGPRGGLRMFLGRGGSLLGLLSREEVQKELKLDEEQVGKVEALSKKLRAEMGEQFTGLREIEDPQKRRAKMAELSDQMDQKVRQQLRDVVSPEQRRRLFQIRMQVRGPVYALNNTFVAGRLKLTDEQKKKAAEIDKSTQEKQSKLLAGLRGASPEQRREAMAQMRKIRQQADKEALALLTAEQTAAFEKMQGKKFELQRRRPQ